MPRKKSKRTRGQACLAACQANPGLIPGNLPDGLLAGAFSRLDPDLPLLLLPVRIETHYDLGADPAELKIRIYPDQVHIDADRPAASEGESKLTRDFWLAWNSASSEAAQKAAWQRYVNQVGSKRAFYLARLLRPTQDQKGKTSDPTPPKPSEKPAPAHPVLLPHQWLAIGYGADGAQIFSKPSLPVDPDIRTGPDPAAASWEVSGAGLAVDEGLAWMIDYERAVQAGMAITISLTGSAAKATEQVSVLLVLGIQENLGPQAASDELARLLDSHARTDGLAFVPQGTPTNNTETASAGWAGEDTDLSDMAARLIKDTPKGPPVEWDDNASHLGKALGFSDDSSLRAAAHGADRENTQSRYMRTVLFEAVMGTTLRQLLKVGDENGVSPTTANAVRSWFIQHVTGGAPIPTLRIGPQPYGILPVRRAADAPDMPTTAGQVENIIAH